MNRNQAAKQQVTKNQHYIPQFLLRQFYYGDSTQLWQIDTQSKELRLVNTKGVASYTNLYEVTALRENLIETWFSELEKRMSYLLNNINKSQYEVVEDDWLLLVTFVVLQLVRTPLMLEASEQWLKKLVNQNRKIPSYQTIGVFTEKELDVLIHDFTRVSLFAFGVKPSTNILFKALLNCLTPCNLILWKSTTPYLLNETFPCYLPVSPIHAPKDALLSNALILPITPYLAICMKTISGEEKTINEGKVVTVSKEWVDYVNDMFIQLPSRFLYTNDK